jgi:hypothetical protein
MRGNLVVDVTSEILLCLKALFWKLPGKTEEYDQNRIWDNREFNPVILEYLPAMLNNTPWSLLRNIWTGIYEISGLTCLLGMSR